MALGRKIGRRLWGTRIADEVDLDEVIDVGKIPERDIVLWQVHLQALVRHRDRSYSGAVRLLRTRGQPLFCSLEPDFCWGQLVSGEFSVHPVPGSHEQIFMEPNVRELARVASECLGRRGTGGEEVEGRASSVTNHKP